MWRGKARQMNRSPCKRCQEFGEARASAHRQIVLSRGCSAKGWCESTFYFFMLKYHRDSLWSWDHQGQWKANKCKERTDSRRPLLGFNIFSQPEVLIYALLVTSWMPGFGLNWTYSISKTSMKRIEPWIWEKRITGDCHEIRKLRWGVQKLYMSTCNLRI